MAKLLGKRIEEAEEISQDEAPSKLDGNLLTQSITPIR
jgi:hypothetical protein